MSFLSNIALKYYQQYGNDLVNISFVFPNRRAGLFFNKYLAQAAKQLGDNPEGVNFAIFAPTITTIDQLFEKLSRFKLADPTEQLFRIYHIYKEVMGNNVDDFDHFVFWGQMLLSDFNEVDMNLVDAEKLYNNIADLKEIEAHFDTLTNEQKSVISRYIYGFEGVEALDTLPQHNEPSQEKSNNYYRELFLTYWKSMFKLYKSLKEDLAKANIAYRGMLSRQVVEEFDSVLESIKNKPWIYSKRYIFVGFNALSETERQLMIKLRDAQIAEFCWDYNHEYLNDDTNRSSLFKDSNLKLFTNAVDQEENKNQPTIHLIEVPSSVGQANIISSLITDIEKKKQDWTEVGIVLPKEQLLNAVRRSIPNCVDKLNITMGQSLATTPIVSLLQHLSELQIMNKPGNGYVMYYYKPVQAILTHPYIDQRWEKETKKRLKDILDNNRTYVSSRIFTNEDTPELFRLIFEPKSDPQDILKKLSKILLKLIEKNPNNDIAIKEKNEYIYQAMLQVSKFSDLVDKYKDIIFNPKTLFSILIKTIKNIRSPFEGEPLEGLQIMGMLESRGMDFKHLIITDVNDDVIPGSSIQQTYIPYALRIAYGLPTPERQDAVVAYNFYRLLSTAYEAWLFVNTSTDKIRSGEPSRFIQQLIYQYKANIDTISVNIEHGKEERLTEKLSVKKTPEMIQRLEKKYCFTEEEIKRGNLPKKGLSASALNNYVICPLHFYLENVKEIEEGDKLSEEIESDTFGTIVHEAMQKLYDTYASKNNQNLRTKITENIIDSMIKRVKDDNIVEDIYRDKQLKNNQRPLEGFDNLHISIMKKYILNILNHDKECINNGNEIYYISSENRYYAAIELNGRHVGIQGIVDRIDLCNQKLRIIDYKTGSDHSSDCKIDELFSAQSKYDHTRQTLFYCLLYKLCGGTENPHPHVFYVKKKKEKEYDKFITIYEEANDGFDSMQNHYEEVLKNKLEEIFNPDIDFINNPSDTNCQYCPFKNVCL